MSKINDGSINDGGPAFPRDHEFTKASNWQPIETAPKDQVVQAWPPLGIDVWHSRAVWCHVEQCWVRYSTIGENPRHIEPVTHWQPLPGPPSA